MTIIDGNRIAEQILGRLKVLIRKQNLRPVLAVVLVGNDRPSEIYVRRKQEAAESIGVKFLLYRFPYEIKQDQLVAEIKKIQRQNLSGIIVQLPLPKALDKKAILNALDPALDVDCLTWISLGKLVIGENMFVPPSANAVLEILKFAKVDLKGKKVVLVGQGDLIGKPLTNLLLHLPLTLTVCNKDTKDLAEITRSADILICGAGVPELIGAGMVKKNAVVIDAGVSFRGKKMFGDVKFEEVSKLASVITPTPGGVGPVTVAKLLENTVLNESKKLKAVNKT